MSYKVFLFQTRRGEFPVSTFIGEQDKPTIAKILRYINFVKNHGPFLKPPYAKKLSNNLYELRIPGKVSIRIFYTIIQGKYYLLHAFKKKTQKTPLQELNTALDRSRQIL